MFGRYIQPQLSPVSFSRCATMVHTRDPPCTTTMVVAWPPEHCGVGTIAHLVPGVPRRARTALPRRLGGRRLAACPPPSRPTGSFSRPLAGPTPSSTPLRRRQVCSIQRRPLVRRCQRQPHQGLAHPRGGRRHGAASLDVKCCF